MEEMWADYPGYVSKYQASNFGRVKSLARTVTEQGGKERPLCERILRQYVLPNGYCSVHLGFGKEHRRYVHRMVLESFVGPCPEGMECRHLDGNKQNNHLENLCWGTGKENSQDKVLHGTSKHPGKNIGIKNPNAKLTEEKVREIRTLYASGKYSQSQLGRIYDIGQDQISCVVRGKSWSHIEEGKECYKRNDKNVGMVGEMNRSAKLTKDKVREIRFLYSEGRYSQEELSGMFGVAPSHIGGIVNGECWKHVQ